MKSEKILIRNPKITLFLLSCLTTLSFTNALAYTPPLGIPDPGMWGSRHPIDATSPLTSVRCPGWPSGQTIGCYYYDPSHPSSTDSSNTYGYPDKPRKTIANGTYGAGTYMFLGGQVTTQSSEIHFNCSEASPCWVTSNTSDQGGFSGGGRLSIWGDTSYLFVENLLINNKTSTDISSAVSITNSPSTTNSAHHICVRNNVIRDVVYRSSDSVMGTTARDGGSTHDIIFYNNDFKNVGNPDDTADLDLHSIGLGLRDVNTTTESYNIWVLNNKFVDSTQGLQINAGVGGNSKLHHIYVGKNYGEHERQRSLSTKQASHVIFSQNEVIPGVNQAAGGYSEGMGWSLGADYIWFLFNNIHNGSDGFRCSDSTGGTSATSHVFIIGNIVHDLSLNPYVTPADRLGNGINFEKGGSTTHVVDNTFNNVLAGFKTEQADTLLYVHGNIFNGIGEGYSFINFYANTPIGNMHISNNLYYTALTTPRWNYTSTNYYSLGAWTSAYPQLNADTYYTNPLLADEANKNYAVTSNSPAIGNNKNENSEYGYADVYALFESLYGIDIRVDYNGNPRPSTGAWTIGAFEEAAASFPAPFIKTINIQ